MGKPHLATAKWRKNIRLATMSARRPTKRPSTMPPIAVGIHRAPGAPATASFAFGAKSKNPSLSLLHGQRSHRHHSALISYPDRSKLCGMSTNLMSKEREVPLLDMKHLLEEVSSKTHTDSYTNYCHFLIAYKVHHHMWRDDQITNLKFTQHPRANQKFRLGT